MSNREPLEFSFDPRDRPDFGMYPPIDYTQPLADQLEVSSAGTSGHKTGESEFDEEYYDEYQEWKTVTEAKQ